MIGVPPFAGPPAAPSPLLGIAAAGTGNPAGPDQALPAEAFAAVLARMIPGRIAPPVRLSEGSAPDAPESGEEVGDADGEGAEAGTTARSGAMTPGTAIAGGTGGRRATAGQTASIRADDPRFGEAHAETPAITAEADEGGASGLAGQTPLAGLLDAGRPSTDPSTRTPASHGITDLAALIPAAPIPSDLAGVPVPLIGDMPGVSGVDPTASWPALGGRAGTATHQAPESVTGRPGPNASLEALMAAVREVAGHAVDHAGILGPASPARPVPASATTAMLDPMQVEKSLDLLHPEFRVRLERVLTRMADEHGHDVDIVETVRNQLRQNHLYEQGRSRPGNIVTWTRASNHTSGVAADVIIDGGYTNPIAYERLHRIASQEGLRTLGARDPGHLELPDSGEILQFASSDESAAPDSRDARQLVSVARSRGISRLATPATVASVARVDTPAAARVATVATPGVSRGGLPARSGGPPPPAPASEESAPGAIPPSGPGLPAPDAPRFDGGALALLDGARLAPTERLAAPPLTSGAAERIAHLLDLQNSAPIRPLSQMFLRVDGPGGEDRIRLDLRGTTLGGSIDLSDPAAAERLSARIGDLHRALEQRGLESEALRIRSIQRAEPAEPARVALATPTDADTIRSTSHRNGGDPSAQRERAPHDPSRDEPREGSPDARQRSPKENRGGRHT